MLRYLFKLINLFVLYIFLEIVSSVFFYRINKNVASVVLMSAVSKFQFTKVSEGLFFLKARKTSLTKVTHDPQIYKGDPRSRIPIPPRVMGLKLGVFEFLPTTHAEKLRNKRKHDASTIFARNAVFHACLFLSSNLKTLRNCRFMVILIAGKTRIPQIRVPYRDKNSTGSGISLVYLWHDLKCRIPAEHFAIILSVTSS